jgi:hypothetical protein
MKNLLLAITIALAGCTAAEAATTEECCMSPLDEFTNSPRRWRNADGSEVNSSSLVKLGPGIVASRPNGAPGEATFATLDAPGIADLQAQIDALGARVTALEAQLEAATAENTAGALVKRDANGDIFTAHFRGDIKEPSEGAMVKIKGFGGVEILRAGEIAGSPAKGWFGATLAIKQERSLSLSAVQDLIYLHETYGDVTVTP